MQDLSIIKEYLNPNYFLMASIVLEIIYFVMLIIEHQKYAAFISGKKKKTEEKSKIDRFFEDFSFFIKTIGYSKHEERLKSIFFFVLITPIGYFLYQGAGYSSFLYPIILIIFINFLFRFTVPVLNNRINKTLPDIIDATCRTMTRNNNLRSIMYEVSVNYDGFLKESIIDLVINMETKPEINCLNEFSEKFTNMHMRSYMILLMSLLSRSKKEEVMENLKALSSTIKAENKMKKDILSEKMGTNVQNWFLSIAAIIAFIGNLRFNEGAAQFFFQSAQGIMCLVVGFGFIFITILFNMKSMS